MFFKQFPCLMYFFLCEVFSFCLGSRKVIKKMNFPTLKIIFIISVVAFYYFMMSFRFRIKTIFKVNLENLLNFMVNVRKY